jgi:hypothetical protein
MSDCPYCSTPDAFALLPAEPVDHHFYYEFNPVTHALERHESPRPGFGHKLRFPIACQTDYNIECKRGASA